MKEKKIHFTRGEVAEIDTHGKVDFETGKEVKREILDRERDRRKTTASTGSKESEKRKRAITRRVNNVDCKNTSIQKR